MSVDLATVLMSPLGLALVSYALLITVLAFIVQPMRLKMVDLAEQMLAEGHWNKEQRREINLLLDTCMSFRVGFLLVVAVAAAILQDLLRIRPEASRAELALARDPRFRSMAPRYLLSVLAANPIAAVITIPLMILSIIVGALTGTSGVRQSVLKPALTAADAMVAQGHAVA